MGYIAIIGPVCVLVGLVVGYLFAKKLKERIENPRVEADHLRGMKDCYKIKLKALGYRLVYEVQDNVLVISVVAVGKRNRSEVYELSSERLK